MIDKEWREGWPVLVACFFGMLMTTVPLVTIGLFMQALLGEFGWGRGEISGVALMYSVIVGTTAPFVGRLVDRIGTRRVALFGCMALPLALASLSLVQSSIYSFWFGWLMIGAP